MHDTAFAIGAKFIELYAPTGPFTVVELGSLDVNGTLRTALPVHASYIGIDVEAGRNVDVVAAGRALPLPAGTADMAIASSVIEHDPTFWLTFLELCRLTKPGGHIYLSAPSNGTVHRYPQDCWRFYPDAGPALAGWAHQNGLDVGLVESFVADRRNDIWNDFVAVFVRGMAPEYRAGNFLHENVAARNIHCCGSTEFINPREPTEDQKGVPGSPVTWLFISEDPSRCY
jgi:SAM-dependent methyltransferase